MRIAKRMSGPAALTTTAATKYTVAASRRGIVRHVHVSNPTASAITFTMSIGADAAGTRVFDAFSIGANTVLDHYPYYVLEAAEIIQAFGSTTSLVLTIDGDEDVLA